MSLIWAGIFISLAVLSMIAINLNKTVEDEAKKAFKRNIKFISESAAKSVKLFMESVVSEIIFQTQLEAIRNYQIKRVDASFRSAIFRTDEKISHMALLDEDGRTLVMVTKFPDPFELDMQISEFYKQTMSGWRVNLSKKMFVSKDYRGIALGMPIFRQNYFQNDINSGPRPIYASGMVLALISINDLANDIINPVQIEKSGFAWITTESKELIGNEIKYTRLAKAIYGNKIDSSQKFVKDFFRVKDGIATPKWISSGNNSNAVEINANGNLWFMANSSIDLYGQEWTITVAAPHEEVIHLINKSFRQSIILVIFVVIILISGGLLVTRVNRRLARAEEKVRSAAELESKNKLLNEMNRRMDEFVSVVSHDIRSPLSVIKGFIKLIQSSDKGKIFNRETTNMLRSANRLTQLTNDILDISKLEAGKMQLALDPIVIDNIILESIEIMEFATKEKNLTPKIHLGNETFMEGDSGKLLQVMNNLIGNAVKFTPSGGTITVGKTTANQNVIISVTDTGPGIGDADRGLVFDKFEQLRRHQQGVEPGSGLGLSICKGIVDLHGGDISVVSKPNRGSTFTVTLPLKQN
ncbi:MAG TPA: sensor histidine kinase [Nitrospinota bacterium]|nr:sensor histidine kinase [Nitrospinota bacterium]